MSTPKQLISKPHKLFSMFVIRLRRLAQSPQQGDQNGLEKVHREIMDTGDHPDPTSL